MSKEININMVDYTILSSELTKYYWGNTSFLPTQGWSFDRGEAIVTTTDNGVLVFLRLNNKNHPAIEVGGVVQALRYFGLMAKIN